MSGNVKHLDTVEFNATVSRYEAHIKEFKGIVEEVNKIGDELLENWKGKGANAFEKDSGQVKLNLKDISEIMYDLRDALVNAETEYLKSDLAMAKNIES